MSSAKYSPFCQVEVEIIDTTPLFYSYSALSVRGHILGYIFIAFGGLVDLQCSLSGI